MRGLSIGDLLSQLDPSGSRRGTIRFPYEEGILAGGRLADAVAYGRFIGLDVHLYRGGGWLVRRGYVVAMGPEYALYRFAERIEAILVPSED